MKPRALFVAGLVITLVSAGCLPPPTNPSLSVSPPPTLKVSITPIFVIENAFAIVHPDGPGYGYGVRFLLRETTGRGSAIVEEVAVTGDNGTDVTGPGCWRDELRVPAGGTLDTFYSDAGSHWLSYCAPGTGGAAPTPSLTIKVTLNDGGTTFTIRQQNVSIR